MSITKTVVAFFLSFTAFAFAQTTEPAVPKGTVTKYTFADSKIFPGTTRDYWIYIPKQYDPAKPACLFVDQDGVQFHSPDVFDRLIASHEMPVTIGIYIQPGVIKAAHPDAAQNRFNRSYEFDSLGDNYVRFLTEEFLPAVTKEHNLNISPDSNARCIAGSSSGAICAFTAAWERPDQFSRVFSAIGTYVGLRGGNVYPTLIRKTEPHPLRIFLQDGSSDNNHYGGDWWMANQEMERALTFCGYEVNHYWGTLGHNHTDGDKIFPDAMRWLWKDYPARITTGKGSEQLQQIVTAGEPWQLVLSSKTHLDGLATDAAGNVYVNDRTHTIKISPDGAQSDSIPGNHGGESFGPEQKLYTVSSPENALLVYDKENKPTTLADNIHGNDLVVANNGNIYLTESSGKPADPQKVWLITAAGQKTLLDGDLKFPNGICLSPDQTLLYVADYRSHWIYSYVIQPDGTVADKQKFHHLHAPDTADDAGPDALRVDRDGRLYVATRMGIQVCDQPGRVVAIIPTPNHNTISNLTFGGPDSSTLYITSGTQLFKHTVKTKGYHPFTAPIKPPTPHL